MEVLSSRVLLSPADFARSRRWYAEILGLRVYREFGVGGEVTGVVFFLGGGYLELSSAGGPATVTLWLQVPDLAAEHERLAATDEVNVVTEPATMPWGQRIVHVMSPERLLVGLTYTPWLREEG